VHRFWAPDLDEGGGLVVLPAEEGRHLVGVLRLRVGDQVAVFDGRGREFTAVVASIGRPGVSLALAAPRRPAPEPAVAISLAQVVLKGEMMDRVVRDLVMMGGSDIQPVVSARAETSLAALGRRGGSSAGSASPWPPPSNAGARSCRRCTIRWRSRHSSRRPPPVTERSG
jgi:16S rRNA (uracil1498-N3)-methyltransferase